MGHWGQTGVDNLKLNAEPAWRRWLSTIVYVAPGLVLMVVVVAAHWWARH